MAVRRVGSCCCTVHKSAARPVHNVCEHCDFVQRVSLNCCADQQCNSISSRAAIAHSLLFSSDNN
eukprot:9150-Heterococcus_DN1.PRE.1